MAGAATAAADGAATAARAAAVSTTPAPAAAAAAAAGAQPRRRPWQSAAKRGIGEAGSVCGDKHVVVYMSICSLMGSIGVMAVKALGISIKLTAAGANHVQNGRISAAQRKR